MTTENGGETSLAVQWLRIYLSMQEVWAQSLAKELRFHRPHRQNTQTWNRNSIVTNSKKDCKNGPHQEKKKTRTIKWWENGFGTSKGRKAIHMEMKKCLVGFPRGSLVKNLPANGFNPWSRKIPHATQQRLVHHNYWACAMEPRNCSYWSPHTIEPEEKPLQWEVWASQLGSSPTLHN